MLYRTRKDTRRIRYDRRRARRAVIRRKLQWLNSCGMAPATVLL